MARELLDTYAMLMPSPVETKYWIEVPFFTRLFQPSANRSVENSCKSLDKLSIQNSDLRIFETFQVFSRL